MMTTAFFCNPPRYCRHRGKTWMAGTGPGHDEGQRTLRTFVMAGRVPAIYALLFLFMHSGTQEPHQRTRGLGGTEALA